MCGVTDGARHEATCEQIKFEPGMLVMVEEAHEMGLFLPGEAEFDEDPEGEDDAKGEAMVEVDADIEGDAEVEKVWDPTQWT